MAKINRCPLCRRRLTGRFHKCPYRNVRIRKRVVKKDSLIGNIFRNL